MKSQWKTDIMEVSINDLWELPEEWKKSRNAAAHTSAIMHMVEMDG